MGAYVVLDVADLVELLPTPQTLEHASVIASALIDAGLSDVVERVVDLRPSYTSQSGAGVLCLIQICIGGICSIWLVFLHV